MHVKNVLAMYRHVYRLRYMNAHPFGCAVCYDAQAKFKAAKMLFKHDRPLAKVK